MENKLQQLRSLLIEADQEKKLEVLFDLIKFMANHNLPGKTILTMKRSMWKNCVKTPRYFSKCFMKKYGFSPKTLLK